MDGQAHHRLTHEGGALTRAVRNFLTNLGTSGALYRGGVMVTLTHEDARHIALNIREGGGLALRRRWTIVPVGSVEQCAKLSGLSGPIPRAPSFAHAPDAVRGRVLTMAAQARAARSSATTEQRAA